MNFRNISKFIIISFFLSNMLSAQNSAIVPGNIIVMLHDNAGAQRLSELLSHVNGISTHLRVKSTLSKNMNIFLFEFDSITIDQELILNIIKASPLVKIAQFNHTVQLRNTPGDSLFDYQWNMNNTGQNGGKLGADIDALKAWDITTGGLTAQGDTIVVAVVDEGFDQQHEDLNFWKNHHEIPNNHIDDDNNGYTDDYNGWNSSTSTDVISTQEHGTHICGIIGAKGCNRIGVTGVNWNIKIMPVSIGNQTEASIVGAYTYVLEQRRLYNQTNGAKGAFVVATSSSFGLDLEQASSHPLWCAMYDSLGSVGILSAGATSNNNYNVDVQGDMPSTCPSNWLITVTNTTSTDTKSTAGYGATMIDLGAPGTEIPSTLPSNNYGLMSGTSMATPHVAGAIALMYSVGCTKFMADYKNNPAAMALIIKDSLLSAVDTVIALKGKTVTGGRLNLYKAVRSILHYYPNDSCIIDPVICPLAPTITVSNDITLSSSSSTGNQWYLNGNAISGATGQTYIVKGNGNYTDVVTIKGLSSPASNIITISNFVSGFSIKNIYPNPTNGILNILFATDKEDAVIYLYNMMGEKVQSLNVTKSDFMQNVYFDLSTIDKGMYFINMSNSNGRTASFKVFVAPGLLKP